MPRYYDADDPWQEAGGHRSSIIVQVHRKVYACPLSQKAKRSSNDRNGAEAEWQLPDCRVGKRDVEPLMSATSGILQVRRPLKSYRAIWPFYEIGVGSLAMLEPEHDTHIFAGLSQVRYKGEPFDLGNGVMLRSAYAHLFAAPMMTFRRAAPGQAHPPPWRAAKGGFAWDIEVELAVPLGQTFPARLEAEQVARLITTLLRLSRYLYIMMPVISDHAFSGAAVQGREPLLRPVEVEERIISAGSPELAEIRDEELSWIRSVWPRTAELLKKERRLADALEAFDACTVDGRTSSALLLAWGALEELFAPGSRSEIRYRIASNLAAFLEPPGPGRLAMFNDVKELYDARSAAAHTSRNSDVEHLLRTCILLRNSLLKIIEDRGLPTAQQFNEALFLGKKF